MTTSHASQDNSFIPDYDYSWELTVVATPVISINNEIFPAEAYFEKLLCINSADELMVDIVYDNVKLDSFNFLNNQAYKSTFLLKDDHKITDHTLEITLSGKNSSHIYADDSVSWLIKIEVYIENLPIMLEDEVVKMVGENSNTTLQLTTPIYRWLLDRDPLIRQAYRVIKV